LRCCSLEEFELRQTNAKKLPLSMRFSQAVLTWSKHNSGCCLGFGFAAGFTVPLAGRCSLFVLRHSMSSNPRDAQPLSFPRHRPSR
jgi:hypothetical protein